jgi:hypothetical protein
MNSRINFSLLITVVLILSVNALAWGDTGHMTVAQIAFSNLTPAKRERAEELAELIELDEREYEFVSAACWMDDIRDKPMFEPLKDWHFITQNFVVGNVTVDNTPSPVSSVTVIRFLRKKMSSRDSKLKKAYYLAGLLHLVGDIHQPLHNVTRFTPGKPDGDLGGNFFLLADDAPRPNLHSYWDAGGGLFEFRDVRRPLSASGRTRLSGIAARIAADFPKNSMNAEIALTDPQVWAREGFDLAVAQVYPGITENSVPGLTYQTNAQRVSARRIALAGYRLAALLERVL